MPRTSNRRWFHLTDHIGSGHYESSVTNMKRLGHSSSDLPLPYGATARQRGQLQSFLRNFLKFLVSRRFLYPLIFFICLFYVKVLSSGIPPTYKDIRQFERALPQHNFSEALKQGTRYLRVGKTVSGRGLNNVLQENLLLSYLALKVNRAFVFDDYIWSHSPLPYAIYDLALRPSRMPLNAFISGPSAGGPMSDAPRAVSSEFWDVMCPSSERHVISSADQPDGVEGVALLDWWVAKLQGVKDRCVEIDSEKKEVFDYILFGETRILSLWPGLSKSPIYTDFQWSPLVQEAVKLNLPMIHPAASIASSNPNDPLSGLVAVHLRRGDFDGHCKFLIKWNVQYMGFNRFPDMLDKFDSKNRPPEVIKDYYMQHCMPDVDQIVERLREVRKVNPGLNRVYALTNGKASWIDGSKVALLKDGWVDVNTSLDLQMDSKQRHVSMAVDMAIAEKAEVFLGNGFSSLSSNVGTLRRAKGFPASSNRLL